MTNIVHRSFLLATRDDSMPGDGAPTVTTVVGPVPLRSSVEKCRGMANVGEE